MLLSLSIFVLASTIRLCIGSKCSKIYEICITLDVIFSSDTKKIDIREKKHGEKDDQFVDLCV